MNEKINVTYLDGRQVAADLICFIENVATGKKYAYYTLNETVGVGASSTVKIYVGNIKLNNPSLDVSISADDWNVLKGYMGDALKNNSNPNIKYLPLSELGQNVDIVSEHAIAMPTSYDYINKQRGIYATAVASLEQAVPAEPAPAPVSPAPSLDQAPVEPVQTDAPAPNSVPNLEPAIDQVPIANEAPTLEPTAPTPVTPSPVPEPVVVEPAPTAITPEPAVDESANGSTGGLQLEPINIAEIEEKYKTMLASLEELKNKEIEAAKRYNATIELSQMHNEQHASYVQNETQKEIPVEPTPNPVPVAGAPINPTPAPAPIVEPTPVTTTVPEPAPAVTEAELETNWFDMPAA